MSYRVPRRTRPAWLSALACAALTACGGGGDAPTSTNTPSPTYLEGPVGQMVALAPEVLAMGTYTVSDCINANGAAVSRKLRLEPNGSVVWLDASNNDAELVRFTPDTTTQQRRIMEVYSGGAYNHFVMTLDAQGNREVEISVEPDVVEVRLNSRSLSDECRNGGSPNTVVNIPVTLTDAVVARKLASAVRSTGASSLATDENITPGGGGTPYRLRRTVTGAGAISHQIDTDPLQTWDNWISALLAPQGPSRAYYSEIWDADQGSGARSPGNPSITVEMVHPTLTSPSGNPMYVMLTRDTSLRADGQAFIRAFVD